MLSAYPLQMLKDKSEGHGPSPALNFKYDSYNTRNYGKEKPLVVPSFRGNYCKNLMYVCVILLEFLSLLSTMLSLPTAARIPSQWPVLVSVCICVWIRSFHYRHLSRSTDSNLILFNSYIVTHSLDKP